MLQRKVALKWRQNEKNGIFDFNRSKNSRQTKFDILIQFILSCLTANKNTYLKRNWPKEKLSKLTGKEMILRTRL